MKIVLPLLVMVCVPFFLTNNSKVPQTVSHLSQTMEASSSAIIKAIQHDQESAFPDNS